MFLWDLQLPREGFGWANQGPHFDLMDTVHKDKVHKMPSLGSVQMLEPGNGGLGSDTPAPGTALCLLCACSSGGSG